MSSSLTKAHYETTVFHSRDELDHIVKTVFQIMKTAFVVWRGYEWPVRQELHVVNEYDFVSFISSPTYFQDQNRSTTFEQSNVMTCFNATGEILVERVNESNFLELQDTVFRQGGLMPNRYHTSYIRSYNKRRFFSRHENSSQSTNLFKWDNIESEFDCGLEGIIQGMFDLIESAIEDRESMEADNHDNLFMTYLRFNYYHRIINSQLDFELGVNYFNVPFYLEFCYIMSVLYLKYSADSSFRCHHALARAISIPVANNFHLHTGITFMPDMERHRNTPGYYASSIEQLVSQASVLSSKYLSFMLRRVILNLAHTMSINSNRHGMLIHRIIEIEQQIMSDQKVAKQYEKYDGCIINRTINESVLTDRMQLYFGNDIIYRHNSMFDSYRYTDDLIDLLLHIFKIFHDINAGLILDFYRGLFKKIPYYALTRVFIQSVEAIFRFYDNIATGRIHNWEITILAGSFSRKTYSDSSTLEKRKKVFTVALSDDFLLYFEQISSHDEIGLNFEYSLKSAHFIMRSARPYKGGALYEFGIHKDIIEIATRVVGIFLKCSESEALKELTRVVIEHNNRLMTIT